MASAKKTTVPRSGVAAVERNTTKQIVIGALVLLALIVAAAIAITMNQRSSTKEAANVKEFQSVVVTGTALPKYCTGQKDEACTPESSVVGRTAPTIQGASFTGEPITIQPDGKNKFVMLFSHHCIHCRNELPKITKWLANAKTKYPNTTFYAVSTGATPLAPNYPPSKWFAKEKYPLPVLADNNAGTAADALGLTSYPFFVTLDKDNKVIARVSGEMPQDKFEALAQGKSVVFDSGGSQTPATPSK